MSMNMSLHMHIAVQEPNLCKLHVTKLRMCAFTLAGSFLQDELVVALPDIRPAAAQHLLVLPREHIPNVTSLIAADTQLGEGAVAARLLQQRRARNTVPAVLLLLFMHAAAPAAQATLH
jgi:hypothetical protein